MTPTPEEVAAMVRALSLGRVRPNEKAAAALLLAQQERITALERERDEAVRELTWRRSQDVAKQEEFFSVLRELEEARKDAGREREAHAQLQARCFDYGGTGQNVFDDLAAAQNDQRRYQWICGRWDECSDESLEEFDRAMNAEDRDAAIDAARQKDGHG
jgi:hypothetical protein